MRLHHYAIRCRDRNRAAGFYEAAFGYKVYEEFDLDFENGEKAKCYALRPPERVWCDGSLTYNMPCGPSCWPQGDGIMYRSTWTQPTQEMHLAPEIFISDGTPGSIVAKWVEKNGQGIHHMAYSVDNVAATMKQWKEMGWATFTTEQPIESPGLIQVFTHPHEFTGVTYEFIKSDGPGFAKNNVKALMMSTEKNGK